MDDNILTRIRKICYNDRQPDASLRDLKQRYRAPGKALIILFLALSSLSIIIASTAIPAYAEELPPGSMLITPYDSFVQIVYVGADCESNNNFGYVNYPVNDPEYRTQIGITGSTSIGTTTELGDFTAGQELILYIENQYDILWLTGPADRCCFDRDLPHTKIERINDSVYRISFEDTVEFLSDLDYNDVVLDVYFIKPTASVSVATGAGGLVNEPSTSTGTVTLSRAFSWPVTVTVAAGSGTAEYGSDYALGISGAADSSAITFEFAPGTTSRTFEVRVKDDLTYNSPNQYFNVYVASTSANAIADTALVPVTISEQYLVPTVRLDPASYTVNEPAAGATVSMPFTVTLSQPCAFDTTVSIGAVAGSAIAGTNYDPAVGSVIIPAGQTSGTGSVTVKGDGLYGFPDKAFGLQITGVDHSLVIGTPSQATVTINEYSSSTEPIPPTVQLSSDTYTALEPAAGTTVTVPFTVTISGPCDFDVTVNMETVAGTAIADEDYDPNVASVTIPAGATSADGSLTIKNDGLFSLLDQTFTLKIAGATAPIGIGAQSQATVTISDLSTTGYVPAVKFNSTSYTVDEPAGYLTTDVPFTVTISEPCDFEVMVTVITVPGSAFIIDDYTTLSTYVVIMPGESSATGYVTVKGDGKYRPTDSYFKLQISSVDHFLAIGSPREATVTIKEATGVAPTVCLNDSAYTIAEPAKGDSVSVPFRVVLSQPCDYDVTVNVSGIDGTALAGKNYDAAIAPVVIPAGETSVQGSAMVKGDGLYSWPNKTFDIQISVASPIAVASPSRATVTINEYSSSTDPVPPTVQFNSTSYTVDEPAGYVATTQVPFNVTLSEPCNFPVMVTVVTVPGTALPVDDYTTLIDPVIINPGESSGTGYVTVKGDGRYSAEDQQFTLRIVGVSIPLRIGTPDEATVTIANCDPKPVVQLNASVYDAPEDGTGYVNITLTGNSSTPVTIQYTIDGAPGTYTFDPATQGFALIPVPVSNEPGIQTGRTLSFTIDGVSDNARLGDPCCADINVLEKEQTFTLHLKKGWNMISSPLVIEPFMASEITQYCPAISQVMQYDTIQQSFSAYLIGISPAEYDFQIQTDVGYLVYADTEADITFTGCVPDDRSIGIGSGWSMIGWSTYSSSDAIEISGMLVPGEQQIMMYDNPASTFTAYLEGISPTDYNFNMAPGNGYLIYTATPTTLNFREIENNV